VKYNRSPRDTPLLKAAKTHQLLPSNIFDQTSRSAKPTAEDKFKVADVETPIEIDSQESNKVDTAP
jgi:hypothetical protein